ncbi:MAG: hypothetical protein P8171_03385 [Candidatus Thiodiazotropha sp.]
MKIRLFIIFLMALLLSGCASNPMKVSDSVVVAPAQKSEAQVVFMRSSFVGKAINASIYDITGDKLEFIGIISNGTKIPYTTSPGKHTFMVVSEAADFMESDLASGKTYYSMVTPRMGVWKARFSIRPIKKDTQYKFNTSSDDFKSWLENTKVAVKSEKAIEWFNDNRDDIAQKKAKYLADWHTKSQQEIAERSLAPQDGLD